jgi:predicted aconitase
MLPRKTGKPIAFKCTEELREQTEAIADRLSISLSDYVRKAVEAFNQGNSIVLTGSTHNAANEPIEWENELHDPRNKPEGETYMSKARKIQKQPPMVQTFQKGGK